MTYDLRDISSLHIEFYLIISIIHYSSNVEPDFELKLDVYAVMMETDLTIASTPRKIKNTIHSSISRTVGKRLASTLKDELNNAKMLVFLQIGHSLFVS